MNGLQTLFVFLVNAIWQICLIAVVALACSKFPRRLPASTKHAIWVLAIGASILLPLLSLMAMRERSLSPSAPLRQVSELRLKIEHSIWLDEDEGSVLASRNRSHIDQWQFLLLGFLYFAAVAYRLTRLGLCWRSMRCVIKAATTDGISDHIRALAMQCRDKLRAQPATILCSNFSKIPFTAGVFRPVIVLPIALLETSDQELRTAIAHEFAHIRRRDYLLHLAAELFSLPVAFHPCLAWMKREAEKTRETACDALAANCLNNSSVYARALLNLARALSQSRLMLTHSTALGVFDGNALEERIVELLDKRPRTKSRAAALMLTFSLLMFSAVCLVGFNFALATNPSGPQDSVGSAANISGTWTGKLIERDANGQQIHHGDLFLQLKQSGTEISGVIGEDEERATPIDNVVLSGNHLTFHAHARGGPKGEVLWVLNLDLHGNEMTGSGHALRSTDNHSWDAEAKFSRQQ